MEEGADSMDANASARETNFHNSESETEVNSYEKKWRQL